MYLISHWRECSRLQRISRVQHMFPSTIAVLGHQHQAMRTDNINTSAFNGSNHFCSGAIITVLLPYLLCWSSMPPGGRKTVGERSSNLLCVWKTNDEWNHTHYSMPPALLFIPCLSPSVRYSHFIIILPSSRTVELVKHQNKVWP